MKKEKDGWDTLFDDEYDDEGNLVEIVDEDDEPEPPKRPKKKKPKKKPIDRNKRHDSILNDVYNKTDTGINIAKKYGVSGAYISQVKTKFRHLKYKPEIKDGKLKCRLCDNQEDLTFHRSYKTGDYIDILCRECDLKAEEDDYVEDPIKLLGQLYSIMATKMKPKTALTESELKIVNLIGGIVEK